MSLKRPLLTLQPNSHALRLHLGGERRRGLRPRVQPLPHHSDEPAAPERADGPKPQIKPSQRPAGQPIGDLVDDSAINLADEPHRDVQVAGRRPPESRRRLGASGEESGRRAAVLVGHGQPEERPRARSYFRVGAFVQC